MKKITVDDLYSNIIFYNEFTEEELLKINKAIIIKLKQLHNIKTINVQRKLYRGAKVWWMHKKSIRMEGVVEEVKRTRANVVSSDVNRWDRRWNVPMSMLNLIEE
jgi:hypothetical protein